ncbi:MAG TPA: ATP-binding protein, partial [Phenylobacterium sp.]|nr:ATP-binding protein [Phenylobacterium sp.]
DGRPRRMIGAVLDITDIRAAEETARRSEQMLAAMLRISPEAIVVTDEAATIMAFSVGAEQIFGYSADEVIGQKVELLLPHRFRQDHQQHVLAFGAGSTPSLRMHDRATILGQRKSGEEFPAEASLARLETPTGLAYTAIVRDLSMQRAAELRLIEAREQAERANLAKSTFLANMSHEIRTPLNGVLGVAGALAQTELTPKQRRMLQLIESSGRALEGLLSDILDLAKVDAGRMTVRDEPFELAALVRETIELFRASASEKGVALVMTLDDRAHGCFRGDDLKIRQVLSNLLSNAIKFTAQGEVCLSVAMGAEADRAPQARFVVRDSGIGFSTEIADSLFERFEQADGSITRRYGGTGLGLAISKSLVNLMGGSISATSAPGRGATFRFEIPLPPYEASLQLTGVAAEPANAPPVRRLQILLAEDHAVNRLTVELILENLPVDITGVENGLEAVEAYERGAFDLVLMDMQMPVMDGLAAIRRIRGFEAAAGRRRTPICILSANAMTDHREAADEAGADHFITKPINAQGLITYVMRVAAAGASEDRAA